MKKLFLISLALLLTFSFIGCDESAEDEIDAPSGLVLTATTDGMGVNLAWTGSITEEIDGYTITFNGTEIATEVTTHSYQHTAPGGLGAYAVTAVKDDESSDPATATSALVEGTSVSIYYLSDPLPDHPSGFGWNKNTGVGTPYSTAVENRPFIDILLDGEMDIVSPDMELDDGNETWFKFYSTYSNITVALENIADYGSYIDGIVGEAAVVALPDGSDYIYAKMEVTSVNSTDHSLTIRWAMQLIPNLRVLN